MFNATKEMHHLLLPPRAAAKYGCVHGKMHFVAHECVYYYFDFLYLVHFAWFIEQAFMPSHQWLILPDVLLLSG